MYAIKGSLLGQTCALATSNDSGWKKSRNRLSKEDRKAMALSFIKRYQISNDGNFPSLNLTHKEVGGSFYTVRELVREIIQDNKVLGPARFDSEVHGDKNSGDYSLESFSSYPQMTLSINELDVVPKHRENGSEEMTLEGNGYCINGQDLDSEADEMSEGSEELARRKSVTGNDQRYVGLEMNHVEDGGFLNGTCTNRIVKDSDKLSSEGSLVRETSNSRKEMELVGIGNAELTLPTQELVVETFPVRPAIKDNDDLNIASFGVLNMNGITNNSVTKHSEIIDRVSSPDSLSDTVSEKGAGGFQHPISEPGIVVQDEVELTNKMLEMVDSLAIKEGSPSVDVDEIASHSGLSSESVTEIDEFQSNNGPKGMNHKENSSSKNSNKRPSFGVAKGNYVNKSVSVDRIDLESWDSTRTSNQETNPLAAMFNAFWNAFAEFWSR